MSVVEKLKQAIPDSHPEKQQLIDAVDTAFDRLWLQREVIGELYSEYEELEMTHHYVIQAHNKGLADYVKQQLERTQQHIDTFARAFTKIGK